MVRYDTKRDILLFILMVFYIRDIHDVLHYILNGVNLKEVVHALHNTCQAFKTHTGVYIAAFQA